MTEDNKVITELVNNSFWFEKPHDNAITTYASGEVVGTRQSLKVKGAGGGGLIRIINVVDNENVKMPIRIWFFRRRPGTVFTDGDTFAPPRVDLRKVARYVDIAAGNYVTVGTRAFAQMVTAPVDFSCPDGELWYYVEARGAGTFAKVNSLDILLGDWPD